jgi:hypothetical protein
MSAQTWAAWVQAIGSVLALIAAIWIIRCQNLRDERRRMRDENDRVVRAYGVSHMFADMVLQAVLELQEAVIDADQVKNRQQRNVLADLLGWGRNIDLQLLAPNAAKSLIQARLVAIQAEQIGTTSLVVKGADTFKRFTDLEIRAQAAATVLAKEADSALAP